MIRSERYYLTFLSLRLGMTTDKVGSWQILCCNLSLSVQSKICTFAGVGSSHTNKNADAGNFKIDSISIKVDSHW